MLVFQIGAHGMEAGFAGDKKPLYSTRFDGSLWSGDGGDRSVEYALHKIVRDVFAQFLLVRPSRSKVYIVENVFLSVPRKRVLCDVFLHGMHVQSVCFLPDVVMSCIAGGTRSGLVVDFGSECLTVVPVYDLRILENWMMCSGVVETGSYFPEGDINCRDELSCGEMVASVLARLPVDLRRQMRERIVLNGGIVKDKSFRERAVRDIEEKLAVVTAGAHAAATPVRFVSTLGPWAGASLYIGHVHRGHHPMELTRESHLTSTADIPDWKTFKYC